MSFVQNGFRSICQTAGRKVVTSRSLVNLRRNFSQLQPNFENKLGSQDQKPGDIDIDWNSLGFSYVPTKATILFETEENGEWGQGKIQGPYLKIHALANVLHYGQTLFEGLKAFHQKNGDVVVFNPLENAKRLRTGSERLGMPQVSDEMFLDAISTAVKENLEYVPPYGTGGALYLRPVLFGNGAQLGLGKASQFSFAVVAVPVGNYYQGSMEAVDAYVSDEYDRAAPLGVGNVKCAGNYAADIVPAEKAASEGYPILLYLDSKERKYVEEFSTSNFIAIDSNRQTLICPSSKSILPSITNIMIQQLARDRGFKVESRPVEFSEVETFSQVAACGTAVIVTPIKSITRGDTTIHIGNKFHELEALYQDIRDIQTGDKEDKHGWCIKVAHK